MIVEKIHATSDEGVSLWASIIDTRCRINFRMSNAQPREEGDLRVVQGNVYIGLIEVHVYFDYPASMSVPISDEQAEARLQVNDEGFVSLVGITVAGCYYPVYGH